MLLISHQDNFPPIKLPPISPSFPSSSCSLSPFPRTAKLARYFTDLKVCLEASEASQPSPYFPATHLPPLLQVAAPVPSRPGGMRRRRNRQSLSQRAVSRAGRLLDPATGFSRPGRGGGPVVAKAEQQLAKPNQSDPTLRKQKK